MKKNRFLLPAVFLLVLAIPTCYILWLLTIYDPKATDEYRRLIEALNNHSQTYLNETYPDIAPQVVRAKDAIQVADGEWVDAETETPLDGQIVFQVFYSNPDNRFMSFSFGYDKNLNLIFDGYKDYYLIGACHYDIQSEDYTKLIDDKFIQLYSDSKNIDVYGSFEKSNFFSFSDIPVDYKGPSLDVIQDMSFEEIANKYGCISFDFNRDEPGRQSIYNRCVEIRDFAQENNIPFAYITVRDRKFQGVFYMSKEELYSDNLYELVQEEY